MAFARPKKLGKGYWSLLRRSSEGEKVISNKGRESFCCAKRGEKGVHREGRCVGAGKQKEQVMYRKKSCAGIPGMKWRGGPGKPSLSSHV